MGDMLNSAQTHGAMVDAGEGNPTEPRLEPETKSGNAFTDKLKEKFKSSSGGPGSQDIQVDTTPPQTAAPGSTMDSTQRYGQIMNYLNSIQGRRIA